MGPMHEGFADELVKTARADLASMAALAAAGGLTGAALRSGALHRLVKRVKKSKDLRDAIRRSAVLGAGTGAATGVLGGDKDKSILRRALGGAAVGAVGGGITGAAFPGWFTKAMRLAPDEVGPLARLGRR